MNVWSIILRSLAAVTLVAYPAFVYFGLSAGSPRQVSLVLLLAMTPALAMRLRGSSRQAVRGLIAVPLTVIAVLAVAAVLDHGNSILATPIATNFVLLLSFGATLRHGSMPMIERFARMQEHDLTAEQQSWCRTWTKIWCAFFVANGTTGLLLAMWAPMKWWALYNGLICYTLIGALFTIEWLLRRRRFPEIRERKTNA